MVWLSASCVPDEAKMQQTNRKKARGVRYADETFARAVSGDDEERLEVQTELATGRHLTELERALTEVVCRTAAKAKHAYQKRKWSPGAKQSETRVPESSGKLLTPAEKRELVDIREAPCSNQDSFRFI